MSNHLVPNNHVSIQMNKTCLLLIISIIFASCSKQPMIDIKNGDILFRGTNTSGLSEAINEVTQTNSATNYTHMGICKVENDTVWVYHAAPEKGVCKEKLALFCQPDNKASYMVDQYRLIQEFQTSINEALSCADKHLGEPYDYSYIIENKGFYCSEFIYEIFKKDSIFKLNPMTFIDPETNEFHKGWVSHYKNLGIEIPEGKPGCNPNEMSISKKIEFIKRVYTTSVKN